MENLVLLYTETPLHAGSGSRVSYIDLPVQRERITDLPMIQASSLKGVLRWDALRSLSAAKGLDTHSNGWSVQIVAAVFGPGEDLKPLNGETDASKFAGAIGIHDARILLFPVRSLQGVFTWLTCPMVLRRLARDIRSILEDSDSSDDPLKKLHDVAASLGRMEGPEESRAVVPEESDVKVDLENKPCVVLEDFVLNIHPQASPDLTKLAQTLDNLLGGSQQTIRALNQGLVLVNDTVFRDFCSMTTEVITRIRIDEKTGTVQQGALWTEELVPSETLFWTLVKLSPPRNGASLKDATRCLHGLLHDRVLQFGGDETLGRGFLRLKSFPTYPESDGGDV